MSPHNGPLQLLAQLDTTSPQLFDLLSAADLVSDLSAEGAQLLVDHLDGILNDTKITLPAREGCLRVLAQTCRVWSIVPRSYTLSSTPLIPGPHPTDCGAVFDIYEGVLENRGADVCIKRIRPCYDRLNEKTRTGMLCQEAAMWKNMSHPNIVPFLGATDTPIQLVSALMTAGNIIRYIQKHPDADRLKLIYDVAAAVNYLHSHNVVHGNIRGSNVFVNDSGRACLTDFGLSTVVPELESPIPAQELCPIRWTAPEILDGKSGITKESDMYAFGMLIVEVLTGAPPFPDSTPTSVVLRISSGGRPKRPKNPIMTDELWKLTQRCLEQDPQRRPEIADVVRCLRKTLTVRRDRVCSTNGIINNQSGESLAGHDVIESKGSWSSLHNDGGQNPPAAPRNLLQRAYSALFSCGKPSAHDYKDSIPVLLTGYNTTGILDASKGADSLVGHMHDQGAFATDSNLDRSARFTLVPQTRYKPSGEQNGWRPQPPIEFGLGGVKLGDAIDPAYFGLRGSEDGVLKPEAVGSIVTIRLEWPGYPSKGHQIRTVDWGVSRMPITRGKLAFEIAKAVGMHIDKIKVLTGLADVTFEELVLMRLVCVSKGTWQPELWYEAPGPSPYSS